MKENILSSFQRTIGKKESGDDDVVDTPVPIPNTEVKHHGGHGILKERAASCRALFFLLLLPFICLFLVYYGKIAMQPLRRFF